MTEATRGLIYRALLLAVVVSIIFIRPDSLEEWLPVLVAILGNGLATSYTTVKKSPPQP
jgi:hypothetical protein